MTDVNAKTIGKQSGARPGRLRLILLVLLSVLALGGGLVAAVGPARIMELAGLGGGDEAGAPDEAEAGEVDAASKDAPSPLATDPSRMAMPFEEIIVNITATTASGRQTSRFLKLDLALIYDQATPTPPGCRSGRSTCATAFRITCAPWTSVTCAAASGWRISNPSCCAAPEPCPAVRPRARSSSPT